MVVNDIKKVNIFYAYSHRDKALMDGLAVHLASKKNYISSWHYREILAGEEWEEEIYNHLKSADIILLLISPDFIASPFCSGKEMVHALKRHKAGECQVIPVLLRKASWEDQPFSKLQVLPTDGRPVTSWRHRDDAFDDIVKGIDEVIGKILSERYIIDAKSYLADNKNEEAIYAYEQAIFQAKRTHTFQYDPSFNIEKGDILVRLYRYQEALDAYKKAVKQASQDIQVLVKIAEVYSVLNALPDALDYYNQAINLANGNPRLYHSKGKILYDLHEYEDALAAYERAIYYDGKNSLYYKEKGDVLRSLHRGEDALAAYEHAIRLQPNNYKFYIDKGDTYFTLGNYENALTAYEKAIDTAYKQEIELNYQDAQIWRNKGSTLIKLQRLEDALVDYEKAVDLDRNNRFLYKEKGDVLSNLERYEEALDDYEEAITLDPSYVHAYLDKSNVLKKLAKQKYDRLMQLAAQAYEQAKKLMQ